MQQCNPVNFRWGYLYYCYCQSDGGGFFLAYEDLGEGFVESTPQWGAADADITVPSGENTELKRPYLATHATLTARDFFLVSSLPVHSRAFFQKPLPIFSRVGCVSLCRPAE